MQTIRHTLAAALALLTIGTAQAVTEPWLTEFKDNGTSLVNGTTAGKSKWRPFVGESTTISLAISYGATGGGGARARPPPWGRPPGPWALGRGSDRPGRGTGPWR